MQYVNFNRKNNKSQAMSDSEENPNTIYFTKESDDSTSGSIIMNGVEYNGFPEIENDGTYILQAIKSGNDITYQWIEQ